MLQKYYKKYYNNFLHTCQVSTLFAGFTEAVLLQFPGPAAGTRIGDILLDNSSQIYYDLSNTTEEVTGDGMVRTR